MKVNKTNLYMQNFLRSPAGEGGDPGAAGGDPPADPPVEDPNLIKMTQEELSALIAKEVNNEVKGLKTKNEELIGKIKKSKDELSKWEGLDDEKVKTLMKQIEENEELKLLAEGKHDEVFERRTEKLRAKYNATIEENANKTTELEQKLQQRETRIKHLLIDQQVKDAFTQEGGVPTALTDVVTRARGTFDIEDDVPVARDRDGDLIRGDDGPITIGEWVQTLKKDAPHLFPPSKGAGLNGSGGSDYGNADEMAELAAKDPAAYIAKRREQKAKAAANGASRY